jgi:hypothetical protein
MQRAAKLLPKHFLLPMLLLVVFGATIGFIALIMNQLEYKKLESTSDVINKNGPE